VYVCSSITLERLEGFQPNLVHIWLYIYNWMYVCMWSNLSQTWYTYNYIYKLMYVSLCVCMSQYNSGTLGAISTKLATHMTIYVCVYIKILYIYNKITSTLQYRQN
jgi:hypothetical protein